MFLVVVITLLLTSLGLYSNYYNWFASNPNRTWTSMNVNSNITGTGTYRVSPYFSTLNDLKNAVIEVDYNLEYNNQVVVTPPESYENYPYFLNSPEDIATGNEDLVIMPRRFPK